MASEAKGLQVTVAYSPAPREVIEWALRLGDGATVMTALQACGLHSAYPDVDLARAEVGIWGSKSAPDVPLRDGDRVEVYRPLLVDPKIARRERFRKQGARAAGLFAGKRQGQKAGY